MKNKIDIIYDIVDYTKDKRIKWSVEQRNKSTVVFLGKMHITKSKSLFFRFNYNDRVGNYYMSVKIHSKVDCTILVMTSDNYIYGADMDLIYYAIENSIT